MNTNKILLAVVFSFIFSLGYSQQTLKLSEESTMSVTGTSTLHDWEAEVNEINANGSFQMNSNDLAEVSSFSLTAKAESLESGKNSMNKNIYEALKSESNPNITFQLKNIQSISGNKITATGDLTIAGYTKEIEVSPEYKMNGNSITLTGEKAIDMTEWEIDPPTAMFGTIKTGEEVTIKYNLILNNN